MPSLSAANEGTGLLQRKALRLHVVGSPGRRTRICSAPPISGWRCRTSDRLRQSAAQPAGLTGPSASLSLKLRSSFTGRLTEAVSPADTAAPPWRRRTCRYFFSVTLAVSLPLRAIVGLDNVRSDRLKVVAQAVTERIQRAVGRIEVARGVICPDSPSPNGRPVFRWL